MSNRVVWVDLSPAGDYKARRFVLSKGSSSVIRDIWCVLRMMAQLGTISAHFNTELQLQYYYKELFGAVYEKNHYLRELVRSDPLDPYYRKHILELKKSIRQADLFICSYRVIINDLETRRTDPTAPTTPETPGANSTGTTDTNLLQSP